MKLDDMYMSSARQSARLHFSEISLWRSTLNFN
jgi:hypothetical protein